MTREEASLLSVFVRNLNNLRAKTSGCLIKDFRHDKKEGSFLNVFVRDLNNGRRRPYGSKKKNSGFPTKNFGNDKKRRSSPLNASIIPLSLIPEWFYCPLFVTPAIFKPGSTVFKNQRKSKNVDA